ncbi:MAG: DUF1186 domain-containing protein [Rhizomicrobium sp.]|jgi:hypothetical protein
MDIAEIIEALGSSKTIPKDAILAAREQQEAAVPAFIAAVNAYVEGKLDAPNADAIFMIFHLLGEWRKKAAYRPLARLLHFPSDAIETALGDATTITCHRVMASVFDGDPQPLYDIILDSNADEYIRARMFDVLAMAVARDELARDEVTRFLRAGFAEIEPQGACFVWDGWQGAVAMLGLSDFAPLVKQIFEREWIDPRWKEFGEFEEDLAYVLANSGQFPSNGPDDEYELMGDVIDQFSTWGPVDDEDRAFEALTDESDLDDEEWQPRRPWERDPPASNPFRHVGRNDPCPCGSGKKFKKCCLESVG